VLHSTGGSINLIFPSLSASIKCCQCSLFLSTGEAKTKALPALGLWKRANSPALPALGLWKRANSPLQITIPSFYFILSTANIVQELSKVMDGKTMATMKETKNRVMQFGFEDCPSAYHLKTLLHWYSHNFTTEFHHIIL
jgi:hypothetical protein